MHVQAALLRHGEPPSLQDHGETSDEKDIGFEGSCSIQNLLIVHRADMQDGHAALAGDGGSRASDNNWNFLVQRLESSRRRGSLVDNEAAHVDARVK